MSTTQPKDLMTLEEVIKGIETLRFYECGSSNRTVANLYDAALHHLEAGRKDTDRLNWMESNESTGFERWSTGWGVSDHSFPDLRQAIDFEMGGKP